MSLPNVSDPFQQKSLASLGSLLAHWRWSILCLALSGSMLGLPVQAHKVELDANVGGTLHIEPNDIPKAGANSLIWIALTQAGGEVIPLSDCDCGLRIYADTYSEGETPIAEPNLKAVSAEGYTAIPGADYVFPEVGAYTLVIAGNPTDTADFAPFELSFEVTVAARANNQEASSNSASPATEDTPPASANNPPEESTASSGTQENAAPVGEQAAPTVNRSMVLAGLGLVGVVGLGLGLKQMSQRK
jgi:hypothetical protein